MHFFPILFVFLAVFCTAIEANYGSPGFVQQYILNGELITMKPSREPADKPAKSQGSNLGRRPFGAKENEKIRKLASAGMPTDGNYMNK
ncbi:unnamed protein product [Caenorhabditis brenneri]